MTSNDTGAPARDDEPDQGGDLPVKPGSARPGEDPGGLDAPGGPTDPEHPSG